MTNYTPFCSKNSFWASIRKFVMLLPLVLLTISSFVNVAIGSTLDDFTNISIRSSFLAEPDNFEADTDQVVKGSQGIIEITFKNGCPKDNSQKFTEDFKEKIVTASNSSIKLTNPTVLETGCKITVNYEVKGTTSATSVKLDIKSNSTDKALTGTIMLKIVNEEALPPGPLVPGLNPQVDIMWSVVPQGITKDNFGRRVGQNFYCIEVVIGNNTGYDLQIASVGFRLGPIKDAAKVGAKVINNVSSKLDESAKAKMAEIDAQIKAANDEAIAASLQAQVDIQQENFDSENDSKKKEDIKRKLDKLKEQTQNANETAKISRASAEALKSAVTKINDSETDLVNNTTSSIAKLTTNSRLAYKQVIPVSSYMIARGSVRHGQFWSARSLLINGLQAFGPFLTGFTPYFHIINHQKNFSEAINIISNPFEKGIERVFPDETVDQMQRLDEQLLRDGMIIPNNRQLRTRTFIPKDLLGLEKEYRDDPAIVTMSLGEMYLIGDTITFLNRVSVTSNPSGEITPPPTVNLIEYSLSLGDTEKLFEISGTFLDGASLVSDDPAHIHIGAVTSTAKTASVKITIDKNAIIGSHTFRLSTKGGIENIPVTFTQPKPEITQKDPPKSADSQPPAINTPDTVYTFKAEGFYFQDAILSVDNNSIEIVPNSTVITDGGTKLTAKIRILDGAKSGDTQTIYIINPQNPNDRVPLLQFTIGNPLPPTVNADGVNQVGDPPPAYKVSKAISLIIKGRNLYNASLDIDNKDKDKGITVHITDNKKTDSLTAEVFSSEKTPPNNYILVLANAGGTSTEKVIFKVGAQEDASITGTNPQKLLATGQDQPIDLVISGENLLQTKVQLPNGLKWQDNEDVSKKESSDGKSLTLKLIVDASITAGSKVTITVNNSNKKTTTGSIDVIAPQ